MRRPKHNRPRKHAAKNDAGPTLAELMRMSVEEPPTQARPPKLKLSEIHLAPKVFQFRAPALEEEREMMEDLTTAIKKGTQRPIDPIVVWPVGQRFYVIDGHHRYQAYRNAGCKGAVPVRHFQGTLKEAMGEAAASNARNKLPFRRNEKTAAAWRLMRRGAMYPELYHTWAEVEDITTASHMSVSRMAEALKILGARAYTMSWDDARKAVRALKNDATDAVDDDVWKKREADKIVKHLAKGPLLLKNPEVTAMALAMVSPKLPEALVEEWLPKAARQLVAVAEENNPDNPEKAEALEEALGQALGFDLREPEDAGDAEDDGWNSL